MSVHQDTSQGLKEALDYVKWDKTKGHSMVVCGIITTLKTI